MRQADYIVDVGPGAGVHGGEIVAAGSVADICKVKRNHWRVSVWPQICRGPRDTPRAARSCASSRPMRTICRTLP